MHRERLKKIEVDRKTAVLSKIEKKNMMVRRSSGRSRRKSRGERGKRARREGSLRWKWSGCNRKRNAKKSSDFRKSWKKMRYSILERRQKKSLKNRYTISKTQ